MIEKIIPILNEANNLLINFFNKKQIIKSKADLSPVSEADMASHNFITSKLKDISDIPILSEEDPVDYNIRKNWNEFWLLDPLDGTKEFINGIGEFSICLALIKENKPVLGFITHPTENKIYAAQKGQGISAYENGEKIPFKISENTEKIALVSRFHTTQETIEFLKKNNIHKTKEIGSALKFISLSEKTANIYPRMQGSKEWDIAAGHLFIEESHKEIIDLETLKPPPYNKENLRNNHFIAYDPNMYNIQEMLESAK